MKMTTISLIGAGGKMGSRITDNLMHFGYGMSYLEKSEAGMRNLQAKGLTAAVKEETLPGSDVVILAVPDVAIGQVAAEVVPLMKSGAMLIVLDPAAAYLGQLPVRPDVSYYAAHPCHPPLFNNETDPAARNDYFGGRLAEQAVVCALIQGPEEHYALGEQIAKDMYAPVMRTHRITVEQMAMLEPTMAETIGAAAASFLKDVMDEAVRRGVPYEAARDFMLGHLHIELAIVFGEAGNPFSDACQVAMEYGRNYWLKPGWEKLFEPDRVREQIDAMLHPAKGSL
ncbi:NAD binding domain of 6-phosphogluconate dehydrogenase [Paenibacillus sp. UNCCL117]|uniref:phosphogluconate dehydrogenase C-terminal domain-containing protein n=1 Tax=unclassified Paenibacillus TaxID=185978 RepID=UPI00088B3E27|nr:MULTISPECIES: phosphogluconate dehydrogenase C-terminal domain-containing protein [unclassified Paenibacillus]SDE26334.1 NAD binding domain of 6-phosphogluconate dehydrogenase [Paenibacillus sp. cl123]SFW62600.1 NAD binding domain of 6-phosphogluconate dehydrogenase [Paenibacillus sp. UNCCL117]